MLTQTTRSRRLFSVAIATALVLSIGATRDAMGDSEEAPSASHVRLTGVLATKGTATVQYSYADPDGDPEEDTEFGWEISNSPGGPWVSIPGITTQNLVIPNSYANRFVRAVVTPSDSNGRLGAPRISEPAKVQLRNGNPATDWFYEGEYGLSHHFLSNYINRVAVNEQEKWRPGEDWNSLLATFDVENYADEVAETGASFVILTLGQNSGYLLGPNETYEEIAGLDPGERTPSQRDLPMEIADALAQRDIRLMFYLPANPPHSASIADGDYAITRAFGYTPGRDGVPTQETMALWQSVIRDYSLRYGDKLAGWWFDGVFPAQQSAYEDYGLSNNYHSLFAAAKAGNPNAIVTINSGVGSEVFNVVTEYEDYTPGESNSIGAVPATGRWGNADTNAQWFNFTYLGAKDPKWAGWGNKGTSNQTANLVKWVEDATQAGGVVGLDTKVNRFGSLDPDQLSQLAEVKEVVKGELPSYYNDDSAKITYLGGWGVNAGRAGNFEGDVHYSGNLGDAATFTFTGTGVDFITEKFIDTGLIDIFLDGNLVDTIDLVGVRPKEAPFVAYSVDDLAREEHELMVVNRSTSAYLIVDAFVVRDQGTCS